MLPPFSIVLAFNINSPRSLTYLSCFPSPAQRALAQIPKDQHNRLARFLEAQDLKDLALQVSVDPEHRFELAMQLKKLTVRSFHIFFIVLIVSCLMR